LNCQDAKFAKRERELREEKIPEISRLLAEKTTNLSPIDLVPTVLRGNAVFDALRRL
jgi:hypothetical protein